MLPNYTKAEQDELLVSHLKHLKDINGISSMMDFYIRFVDPDYTRQRFPARFDLWTKTAVIYDALGLDCGMDEFFLNTSCYPAVAPLLSKYSQSKQIIDAFWRTKDNRSPWYWTKSITPVLRRCPQCKCEDIQRLGRWYYRRSHQIPGVHICHIHGCMLEKYVGMPGGEMDDDAVFEQCDNYAGIKEMHGISLFANGLLNLALDTNAEETTAVIIHELKAKGLYDEQGGYRLLEEMLSKRGLRDSFPRSFAYCVNRGLKSPSDHDVKWLLVLLYFLFETAERFASALYTLVQSNLPYEPTITGLRICGTWRRCISEFKCEICGHVFCATEQSILAGWGCPSCSKRMMTKDHLEEKVHIVGGGEYELLASKTGTHPRVVLKHICGNELSLRTKEFFEENVRCNCKGKEVLQTVAAQLERHSGLRFFGYDFSRKTVSLLNEQSGAVKVLPLHQLNADMIRMDAPIRIPWTHEMFVDRVTDLVGDEYDVVSCYVDHGQSVLIRHNRCGDTKAYIAHRFIHGERCDVCGEVYSPEKLRALIPSLSQGEYEFGGSEGDGLLRIKSRKNKADKILPIPYAVQELIRPTPSKALPYGKRIDHLIQNNFLDRQLKRFEGLLLEHYADRKFIFLDDFAMDQEDYQNAQSAIKALMAQTKAFSLIQKDVYVRKGETYSMKEMLLERYCNRPDGILGYLSGESLAYEIGLIQDQPQTLHLVSMLDADMEGRELHLRKRTTLFLRGSKHLLTAENYKAHQILDFLSHPEWYEESASTGGYILIHQYLKKNGVRKSDLDPYISLYEYWVSAVVDEIFQMAEGGTNENTK